MRSEATLAGRYVARHPAAAARALGELDARDVASFLEALRPEDVDALLGSMSPDEASEVLGALTPLRQQEIVDRIASARAASLLRRLPREARAELLERLPAPRRRRLIRALRFDEGTAGGIADPDPPAVAPDAAVKSALKRLHRRGADLPYVYVTDRAYRLVGVVSRQELRRARPEVPVSHVMSPKVLKIPAGARLADLPEHPAWRELDALPVVDASDGLVGILRHKTLRRHLGRHQRSRNRRSKGGDVLTLGTAYCELLARALVALTTTPGEIGRHPGTPSASAEVRHG